MILQRYLSLLGLAALAACGPAAPDIAPPPVSACDTITLRDIPLAEPEVELPVFRSRAWRGGLTRR